MDTIGESNKKGIGRNGKGNEEGFGKSGRRRHKRPFFFLLHYIPKKKHGAWALRTIPYGEVRSYKDIAAQIGNEKACRAVGGANNRNPLLLLNPCHRVVGADGSPVGFACGVEIKEKLLLLERANGREDGTEII